MTETEMQVLVVKGLISQLPQADQDEVRGIASELRQIIQDGGELGIIALVLVAAEHAENT
ncbi:MAG: hypothetical protein ACXW1D_00515 [Halobacteriota archaeon]